MFPGPPTTSANNTKTNRIWVKTLLYTREYAKNMSNKFKRSLKPFELLVSLRGVERKNDSDYGVFLQKI